MPKIQQTNKLETFLTSCPVEAMLRHFDSGASLRHSPALGVSIQGPEEVVDFVFI